RGGEGAPKEREVRGVRERHPVEEEQPRRAGGQGGRGHGAMLPRGGGPSSLAAVAESPPSDRDWISAAKAFFVAKERARRVAFRLREIAKERRLAYAGARA